MPLPASPALPVARRQPALALAVGAVGAGAAAALRDIFGGLASGGAAVLLFVPAVVGAAALGGFVPGIIATVVAAGALFLLHAGLTGILLFLLVGLALAIGGEWFQRSVERAS